MYIFKTLSKNPSHGFPQQISDMCCFFSLKNTYMPSDLNLWPIRFSLWLHKPLESSPTEARLHTMETTAGCGVATNGPLHGGRCKPATLWIELHPVEGQAFLEICQCLTQQMNPFKSFQKNSKTHIATYYHIIVIYMFLFYFVFIFVHS